MIRQRPPLSLVAGPWNEADPAGPLVGMQLAHFELREFVGGGGMGAVYRALDTLLNREVAVKVLSPDLARDPEVVRRFKNEAQSAARLDHEHITRVYFVGEDQGWHYIVFEFIEGVNVRDFVARGGPLPLADALLYTVQIARAIEHASSRDVVHRDIKPSNVLIAGPGRVKVVDMGLARVLLVDQSSADLTASGVTLGTFDYISPEQARDPRAADVRSDLYSLGCTLYFMLTGRPPFPQGTVLQKLLQHQGDEPPDPREVRPDLPVELTQIVRRMMAKSPAQRYQSPRALIADLSNLAARLNLPLAPLDQGWMPAPAPSFDWARQLNWALPVAALLVIVLVLDALWRPSNAPPARPQATDAARTLAQDPLNGTGAEKQSPGTKAKTNDVADSAARPSPPTTQRSGEGASARPSRTTSGGFATLLRSAGGIFKKTAEAWLESPAPRANSAAAAPSPAPTSPRVAQPNVAPAAAQPAAVTTAPPAAVSDGLLVVTDEPLAPREYRSLRTACSVAKDGEIIELRFDGRREAEPVTVGMRRVTIRPGKGYRPVIVFRPNQTDPIRYPRSMISVAGGRLTLLNLQVELEVPPLEAIPAASWSLIASQRAELIRLEGCNLSIRNAGVGRAALHPDVAFFDFKPPPGSDSMMMGSLAPRDLTEGRIDLEDCVLRGEAYWLRVADSQPLHVTWNNGLLAISERAVNLAPRTMSDRAPGTLRLDLRHLTAAVANGLVRLPSPQDFPLHRALEVDCADSIWLGQNEPFVTQLGAAGSGDLRGSLAWKGGRNFFLGFPAMYGRAGDRSASPLSSLTFAQWQGQWGAPQEKQLTRADFVELPEAARPFHGHLVEDYALDDQAWDNPALGGASDSQDAGVLAAGLTSGGTPPARLAPETRAALDAIP
ncbi:MAG: serine/threonine-protein kinase [Pirellulales bacterium]